MGTRNKYYKVKNQQNQEETEVETDIRIGAKTSVKTLIIKAATLLLDQKNPHTFVTLKAAGNAIHKALLLSEIIKRRIKGLHQINTITSTTVKDVYEPKEEGLDTVIQERTLSLLIVKLTTKLESGEDKLVGYQAPLKDSEVEEMDLEKIINYNSGGRGGERGGYRGDRDNRDRSDRRGQGGYGGGQRRNRGGYNNNYRGGDREDRGGDRGTGSRGGDREQRNENKSGDRQDNRDNRDNRGQDRQDNRGQDRQGGYRKQNSTRGGGQGGSTRRNDNN